jgi:AcrR family transcriptional regulator
MNPKPTLSKDRLRRKRPTQAERREESTRRILTASMKLLAQNGYDRFSLQDVGRHAGCSYELVNHYFGNKQGLISEMVKHIIASFENITLQIGETPTGFERLAAYIRLFTAPANKPSLEFTCYRRLWGEAPYDPMLSSLFKKRSQQTIELLRDTIVRGQQSGEIIGNADPQLWAAMIYEYIRGHADVMALLQEEEWSRGAGSEDTVEVFIDGLRLSIQTKGFHADTHEIPHA